MNPFSLRLPAWVWAAALAAGLLHMAPYWRASWQTPDGWEFTGNLHSSPDYMQYRVWERQSQEEGIFVSNRFTAEPNPPHLPMLLYWSIGRAASLTGLTPEWVYVWLGGLLAVAFTLLLYATVRHFLPTPSATAWVFWVLLVGGGLTGVLAFLERSGLGKRWSIVQRLVVEPLSGPGQAAPFEAYRGNYIVQALLDTHFMVLWVVALAAVLALYATITSFSVPRLALTAVCFAAASFLHVYEGFLLVVLTAGVCLVCWRKGLPGRVAAATFATCTAAVGAVLVPLAMRFQASGLPLPTWRGVIVAPVILLLAYPLAWILIGGGLGRFWREAGMPGAFLLGWALGCLVITLSGPFYPYPDRGILTLQIPLLVVAGMIYFSGGRGVSRLGLLTVIVLHASSPLLMFSELPRRTRFDPAATHKWISTEHRAIIEALGDASSRDDLLLADETSLRWLAPEFPGRHYAAHFFLTTGYEPKRARVAAFYSSDDTAARRAFLSREGVRFLYVTAKQGPEVFADIPSLRPLRVASVGTLFEVMPAGTP